MKYSSKSKKTSFIPRSILQNIEKIKQTLSPNAEQKVIEEFRAFRQITISSIRYLLILMIVPLLVNHFSKIFVIYPLIDKFWNPEASRIFLNSFQEERALAELKRFEREIQFQTLLGKAPELSPKAIEEKVKDEAIALAQKYKWESTDAIGNIFADILSLFSFITLCIFGKQQMRVIKLFTDEIFYGLSDSAKAFLIILSTDIFVGYHSPYAWEIILENILKHFGLPDNKSLISLFIATVPVTMDTVFKYWVFRYLNRSSPSAVATYRNMNE
ncbi:CemA family protein [Iningainema tapete]|uniref:Proton extrusion protein PxcA n=1 Tax=Iningainema tapete BLCC-T55 TaxID=2748662 RepID=A0A8J6XR64_9CYAN|nr:CemA family protein [Iningainema tapete]MBD2772078.1 CemA family protein [Iningainema tapete BLCC-T55]